MKVVAADFAGADFLPGTKVSFVAPKDKKRSINQ